MILSCRYKLIVLRVESLQTTLESIPVLALTVCLHTILYSIAE